jgi:hypothetical protein
MPIELSVPSHQSKVYGFLHVNNREQEAGPTGSHLRKDIMVDWLNKTCTKALQLLLVSQVTKRGLLSRTDKYCYEL